MLIALSKLKRYPVVKLRRYRLLFIVHWFLLFLLFILLLLLFSTVAVSSFPAVPFVFARRVRSDVVPEQDGFLNYKWIQ